jgi:hypothetical protein
MQSRFVGRSEASEQQCAAFLAREETWRFPDGLSLPVHIAQESRVVEEPEEVASRLEAV